MAHDTLTFNTPRKVYPFIGNMVERLTADASGINPNWGFIPAVTGFARVMSGVGTALVDIPTVAGIYVPIDIKQFDKANSTASQELVIVRQGG
jgi:hypothetical protein